MSRLSPDNVERARAVIARYPQARSALLPLLHLAQAQDGYVTDDAMEHIAELVGLSAAEVLGTASFYTMFKREPTGRCLVSICTNIACLLDGAYELVEHAEASLGVSLDETTADGEFTLEEAECLALCDRAPCVQFNYRYFASVTPEQFDQLCADWRAGRLEADVPPHGVIVRSGPAATSWQNAADPHRPKPWAAERDAAAAAGRREIRG